MWQKCVKKTSYFKYQLFKKWKIIHRMKRKYFYTESGFWIPVAVILIAYIYCYIAVQQK